MTQRPIETLLCILLAMVGLGFATRAVADGPSPLENRQKRAFSQICAQCHAGPGLGGPIVGDATEWKVRRAKGFEVLVANTVTGVGGMPPLGTCGFCTEDDFRRLVAFMAAIPPESKP